MDRFTAQVRREAAQGARTRLSSFVNEHEQRLFDTQQHLRWPSDATYWYRPEDVVTVLLNDTAGHTSIGPHHQPRQRTQLQQCSLADLIGMNMMTTDPFLFRLIVCLAGLLTEMQSLAEEGRRRIAPPLALFGDEGQSSYGARQSRGQTTAGDRSPSVVGSSPRGAAGVASPGANARHLAATQLTEQAELLEEEALLHGTGSLLPHLQDIWLWRRRVQVVCARVVCQLACVHDVDGAGTKARGCTAPAVRFTSCWDALGELLGVVVLVDEVLQQNPSIRDGVELMQRVVAQQTLEMAREDEPEDSEEDLLRLLLQRLQADLIDRRLLDGVVGQPFDRLLKEQVQESDGASPQSGRPSSHAFAPPPPLHEHREFCIEMAAVLEERCIGIDCTLASPRAVEAQPILVAVCGLSRLFQAMFLRRPASGSSGSRTAAPVTVAATTVSKTAAAKVLAISKHMITWQSSVPLVPLQGVYVLCPLLWWQRCFSAEVAAAVMAKGAVGQLIQQSVTNACQAARTVFVARVEQWGLQVDRWVAAEVQRTVPLDLPLCRQFVQLIVLLIQRGLRLAQDIQAGTLELLALHHQAECAVTTTLVQAVLDAVLLLQRIATAYHGKMGVLATAHEAVTQSLAYALEKHLYNLFTRGCGNRENKSPPAPADQLLALQAALHLLRSPLTTDVLTCLALLLDVALNREQLSNSAAPPSSAAERERDDAFIALVQLQRIVHYQQTLPTLTDTSFLFYFRDSLFPLFFRYCYQHPLAASTLPALVSALMDSRQLLMTAQHVTDPAATLLSSYVDFVRDCLEHELVLPLCTEVETQLRLRTHDAVLGQPYRLLRPSVDPAGRDLTRFTRLPPFKLCHEWVHIAALVEHYLSTQFYNLNALTPNDWRTYEEMRNLALRSYGLHIADGHLPGCILDQGLDVLVITENIQQFIVYYTYNMNEQVFIQRPSLTGSKHLHTLNTRHIANSIRTHGTGVMNTAVNYVYKCLLRKLAILSHFLQDDYVRSHLLKDARLVRQRKKEQQTIKYPVEQAEQLVRAMERLGTAADGVPFLEKARHLINEMGNALGFMRMMRSGGLRAVAEGARFVPLLPGSAAPPSSLQAHLSSAAAVGPAQGKATAVEHSWEEEEEAEEKEEEEANGAAVEASQRLRLSARAAVINLDDITQSMLQQLSDGSEYFPLLLRAVGRRLRRSSSAQYTHLHLLYLLIPALANLHVAYAVQEKEKLLKKHEDEGVFSDDGFAVGATFLLVLLDVYDEFDSLHWFDNKKSQHRQKLESVHAALDAAAVRGTSAFDNLYLTSATMQANLSAYTGLENAFISSRLFFGTAASHPAEEDALRKPRSCPSKAREEENEEEEDEEDVA